MIVRRDCFQVVIENGALQEIIRQRIGRQVVEQAAERARDKQYVAIHAQDKVTPGFGKDALARAGGADRLAKRDVAIVGN